MALNGILGKFKPKKPPVAQPGRVPARPQVQVRQDKPATAPPAPKPAGGQGPVQVIQPPMGPDESWKDGLYNTSKSNIQTGLNNLQGYLTAGGNQLGLEYGIDFDRDPTDPLKGSNFRIGENVDVTNPFSRAALLARSHKQNVAGNTNSMAARGQLYSGALQNAQNAEGLNYLGGQNALKTDFAGRFGGLYGQWLQAQREGSDADLAAQAAAFERNKNSPAAGTGYATGGAAAPGTNTSQYADSAIPGKQPSALTSQAVRDYLAKQRKTKAGKSKKPAKGAGRTGGARAPGG